MKKGKKRVRPNKCFNIHLNRFFGHAIWTSTRVKTNGFDGGKNIILHESERWTYDVKSY